MWQVQPESPQSRELARDLGISEVTARCLLRRGIDSPQAARAFLQPTLAAGLRSPLLMRDMDLAARRVIEGLRRRERIAVYGDYDVDGITGAAILVRGLRELGADPFLFVPDRWEHGYGLCAQGVAEVAEAGATLMITADCGATSHAEIELAGQRGIDVVVCDHHAAPATRPPAAAVLNPTQPGCDFPFKGLCGAGVAFYLLLGVRMLLRQAGEAELPDLRRYLDLVALGSIADVVPLRFENRAMVAHGLRHMAQSPWPGLRALLRQASVETVSAGAVAYRIAPRLNASGRVGRARDAVDLLVETSETRVRDLVLTLEACNHRRREIEAEVLSAASEQLAAEALPTAAVVCGEGWHPGVVGIVAARLCDAHAIPVAVIAVAGDLARGSARSVPGVDVLAALRSCGDLFERLGGHPRAAGFTLRTERIAALRERLADAVGSGLGDGRASDPPRADAALAAEDFSLDLVHELAGIEPCGEGNPEPALVLQGAVVHRSRIVGAGHHLLELAAGSRRFAAIAFRASGALPEVGTRLDLLGAPEIDTFGSRTQPRLRILGLRSTQAAVSLPA